MGGWEKVKPCGKICTKHFRLFILAYQFIETFGINSVAIIPEDLNNLIPSLFFFFFSKAVYALINSFDILD